MRATAAFGLAGHRETHVAEPLTVRPSRVSAVDLRGSSAADRMCVRIPDGLFGAPTNEDIDV
ncbi:MAG TPA: hypothetical protein VFC97_07540, partial [Verrucomicrobiae bacterium]|nr:hypothetical protein [Verrucomicrobiae bacterium]